MPLKACIFLFLILISTSHPADPTWSKDAAGWNVDGQAVADSDSRKSRNGFGAMLLLIDDPKFFEDWKKPEAPKFKTISTARRLVPIHATILFAGAGSNDDDGKAHVICDVKVLKPDGSIYGAREGMIATKNPMPSATTLLLASERLVVRIEPKDPAGIYVVEAVVKDKIKNIDLKLKQSFSIEK
jgi:hypothetical protein